MTQKFGEGARVRWNWGPGQAEGKVREVFTRRVQRTLKGSTITRDGDEENPAYLIEQDDGDQVLKSHSELHKA